MYTWGSVIDLKGGLNVHDVFLPQIVGNQYILVY